MLRRTRVSLSSRQSPKSTLLHSISPLVWTTPSHSISPTSIKSCSSNRTTGLTSLKCSSVSVPGYETFYLRRGEPNPGSPFTSPIGSLPAADAQNIKIRDHGLNVLFSTPFSSQCWHNFAVVIDWDNLTLAVFYSIGAQPLKLVSATKPNQGAVAGTNGQGEFHFGILKVCYHSFDKIARSDETSK